VRPETMERWRSTLVTVHAQMSELCESMVSGIEEMGTEHPCSESRSQLVGSALLTVLCIEDAIEIANSTPCPAYVTRHCPRLVAADVVIKRIEDF
jgi:hypothetical protein